VLPGGAPGTTVGCLRVGSARRRPPRGTSEGWRSGGARPNPSPLRYDLGSKGLARCKAVSQERPDALATGWVVQVVVRCSSVGLETWRWELSGVSPAVLEAGGSPGYGYEDKAPWRRRCGQQERLPQTGGLCGQCVAIQMKVQPEFGRCRRRRRPWVLYPP
jgi:hypothetical protein